MFGGREILILIILAIVLFNARRIPEIMGGVAKGIKNFRKGMSDTDTDEDKAGAAGQPRAEELKRITHAPGERVEDAERSRTRTDQ